MPRCSGYASHAVHTAQIWPNGLRTVKVTKFKIVKVFTFRFPKRTNMIRSTKVTSSKGSQQDTTTNFTSSLTTALSLAQKCKITIDWPNGSAQIRPYEIHCQHVPLLQPLQQYQFLHHLCLSLQFLFIIIFLTKQERCEHLLEFY